MKQRFLSMLVLLVAVVSGAWAQTETLLTTITATGTEQASYSTANVATVSFSNLPNNSSHYTANWGWWGYGFTATVTAAEGYTITKCVFYDNDGASVTDSTDPFIVETEEQNKKPKVNGATFGAFTSAGIKKIEVYGYAKYSVTLAEGTEDAGNWSVPKEAAEGSPVTITYSGEKKVKSVKAVKKAVAPTYTLLSAATTEDVGKVVCAAGHLHDAKTAVPSGCTAVGILGKVTSTGHGLILALQDAKQSTGAKINNEWTSVTTFAGTTLKKVPDDILGTKLTSYTTLGETAVSNWAVAQKSDYEAIFTNLGSTKSNDGTTYDDNVNAYITGAGGAAIASDNWSASIPGNSGWLFYSDRWYTYGIPYVTNVRPVLGF